MKRFLWICAGITVWTISACGLFEQKTVVQPTGNPSTNVAMTVSTQSTTIPEPKVVKHRNDAIESYIKRTQKVLVRPKQPHKTTQTIAQTRAEDIYSVAINLMYEGDFEYALDKLNYLIENGIDDVYVYDATLNTYTQMIQKYQSTGKDPKKAVAEAIKLSESAVKHHPMNKRLRCYYIDFLRSAGDYKKYLKNLEELYKVDNYDTYANYYLGAYYYMQSQMDKAVGYLKNVATFAETKEQFDYLALYNSHYYLGMIYIGDKHYRDAASEFEKAIQIYNGNPDVQKYLTYIYATVLDFDNALENIRQIPNIFWDQNLIETYAGLLLYTGSSDLGDFATEYASKSQLVKSIDQYCKGLYDESLKTLMKYGSSDFYSLYLAYLDYEAMTNKNSQMTTSLLLSAKAKDMEQYDLALKYLRWMETETNMIPNVFWLIGSAYDSKKDYTNAVVYYEKYLGYTNQSQFEIQPRLRLSYAYYQSGRTNNALKMIDEVKSKIKTDDDQYVAYYYSGMLNMELKDYPRAEQELLQAIGKGRKDEKLNYFLGVCYYELKELDKATNILLQGRKITKDSPEINNLLAYVYSLQNAKLDEAVDLVQSALKKDPENIAYLDTLGWIYFKKNDIEKASQVFRRIEIIVDNQTSKSGLDEVYYHLGALYENKNNIERANYYYRKALEINPKNKDAEMKVSGTID